MSFTPRPSWRILFVMHPVLSEAEFELIADETLDALVEALADLEDDGLDVDLESGVLTLRYEDGSRQVINSHRAASQIWMAAGTTAWHFSWNGSHWVATRSGDELWSTTERKVGEKLGRPVSLRKSKTIRS